MTIGLCLELFHFHARGVSFQCGYSTDISSSLWSCDCCSFIYWSGINSSRLHHEWIHICLISDQQNFGCTDFYNHVHKIKALWTHLNESRLGRSELCGNPLTDELIRSQLKEKRSSECDSSVLLLMSPAPVPQKSDSSPLPLVGLYLSSLQPGDELWTMYKHKEHPHKTNISS